MTGILKLSKQTVKDAMIAAKKVFMISSSTRLDEKSLYDILDCGFSRIIVYRKHDKQHITGYLLVKGLIVVSTLSVRFFWPSAWLSF
jgi:CBS domain containing-hemolysin-like protein